VGRLGDLGELYLLPGGYSSAIERVKKEWVPKIYYLQTKERALIREEGGGLLSLLTSSWRVQRRRKILPSPFGKKQSHLRLRAGWQPMGKGEVINPKDKGEKTKGLDAGGVVWFLLTTSPLLRGRGTQLKGRRSIKSKEREGASIHSGIMRSKAYDLWQWGGNRVQERGGFSFKKGRRKGRHRAGQISKRRKGLIPIP